jgi:hypothetical protein
MLNLAQSSRVSCGLLLSAALAASLLGCSRHQSETIDRRAYTESHAPKQSPAIGDQANMMARDIVCSDIPDRCCTSKGFCCTFRPKLPPICG